MKKPVVILLLLLISLVVLFSIFKPWGNGVSDNQLTLYGNVDIREVRLGFRVAGRLKAMELEEGDSVLANMLLATLDGEPFREALAVDDARVQQARAQLEKLENGSRPQEIDTAKARVIETKAVLLRAEQDLERQRQLMAEGVGSQRQLDTALALRDQTLAQLNSRQESLELATEGPRQEDISAARASLAMALAKRERTQTQLDDTQLYAPSAGTIMTRIREPGAMLAAGEPVYALSLTDKIYVRAYVSEQALGKVVPGTTVTVKTDSSDKYFQGQVGFVSPRAEFTPKTVETPELRTDLVYRLRIVVNNADSSLRQGMPVTITLDR